MRITVDDIRRAILSGGDASAYTGTYERAIGGAPFPVLADFNLPLALPPVSMLADRPRETVTMAARADADKPSAIPLAFDMPDVRLLKFPSGDVRDRSLSTIIDDFGPEVICVDCSPEELGARITYAFSLPCAVGLNVQLEIVSREAVAIRFNGECCPAGIVETAILQSWLRRIPLVAAGQPAADVHVRTEEDWLYVASRIKDAAARYSKTGQPVRVLFLTDPARHKHSAHFAALLKEQVEDRLYTPPRRNATQNDMVVVGHVFAGSTEAMRDEIPEGLSATQLFQAALEKQAENMAAEALSRDDTTRLVAEIAGRVRSHADVARGASVRGTIAFYEVLGALAGMTGAATRESIHKAALITLPSRVTTRNSINATVLVEDTVKEVLYGVRFSGHYPDAEHQPGNGLSPEGTPDSRNIAGKNTQSDVKSGEKGAFSVVPEEGESVRPGETMRPLGRDSRERYLSAKRAILSLISNLESRLRAGEISPDEFERRKAGLLGKLRDLAGPAMRMSSAEMASTIMELMDAQDKQWNNEVSFNRMHVYYHAKGTSERTGLGTFKGDYHALKWLIDDMQGQGILKSAGQTAGLLLTGIALNLLLEYLSDERRRSSGETEPGLTGPSPSPERFEIRRYRRGDSFHDLSIRHTLRAMARHRVAALEAGDSDIRVFSKQKRKPHRDLVLCIDTSGSMGFDHKLTYARLAAAGIVKAALKNGDRAGVVAFHDRGKTVVPLTHTDEALLLDGVAAVSASGNTNIGDGIRAATELLVRRPSRNRKQVIVITDGKASAVSEAVFSRLKPSREHDLTEESAFWETSRAAAAGINVSVVYVAPQDEAVDAFVRNIASIGRGRIYRVRAFSDLNTMAADKRAEMPLQRK